MPKPRVKQSVPCDACGRHFNPFEVRPVQLVHEPLLVVIKQANPEATLQGFVCLEDLAADNRRTS